MLASAPASAQCHRLHLRELSGDTSLSKRHLLRGQEMELTSHQERLQPELGGQSFMLFRGPSKISSLLCQLFKEQLEISSCL